MKSKHTTVALALTLAALAALAAPTPARAQAPFPAFPPGPVQQDRGSVVNVCDGFVNEDAQITASTALFHSASARFTQADVGKRITIDGAGPGSTGPGSVPLITTIAAVTDSNDVTLAATAATTLYYGHWGYGSDYSAAINAVLLTGARLPPGVCGHASTITLGTQQLFTGQGAGVFGLARTTLMWLGPAGGTQVAANAVAATSGITFGDMQIDGMCSAAFGVSLKGVQGSHFLPVTVLNQTNTAVFLDTTATYGLGLNDFYHWNMIANLPCSAATKGLVFGPGTNTWDTYSNNFYNTYTITTNGTGFECNNADSNKFFGFMSLTTGTALSFDLKGSNISTNVACRDNSMWGSVPQGNVTARGTGLTYPAVRNYVEINRQSGWYNPVIETGASLFWRDTTGQFRIHDLILTGIPTSCTSQPTGTVASVSGTLTLCP